MASNAMFATVASLVGDPVRAGMLHALMDGRALTASELAQVGRVTPQTASGHLTRMAAVGLLSLEKQGRHRYYRLASQAVAQMIESIMQVASGLEGKRPLFVGPRDVALRTARTCYDHLAGRLGVALADALVTVATRSWRAMRDWSPTPASSSSPEWASTLMPCWHGAASAPRACSAGPVSIGASGDRIWRA
jgi:DNA-binding transcriptional ArsR family regulator